MTRTHADPINLAGGDGRQQETQGVVEIKFKFQVQPQISTQNVVNVVLIQNLKQ